MKSSVEDAARMVRSLPYASIYPRQYVAHRVDVLPPSSSTLSPGGVESSSSSSSSPTAVLIDGDITKSFWSNIPWSSDFVDIATTTPPQYTTRMKMKWDDNYLYVAAYLEEPNVWGTLTEHNSIIYQDNDFEIFVDTDGSNHNYKEFEINALGTTWTLLLNKPYDDGGCEDSKRIHPTSGYDMEPEIYSAVQVYPTNDSINNPRLPNTHWTVEVALPISKLMLHNPFAVPPTDGVYWRVNFSRVQWAYDIINNTYVKRKCCQSCANPGTEAEDNWVWSTQGQVAMHLPERWGILQFTTQPSSSTAASSYDDDDDGVRGEEYYTEWPCRCAAMAIYYAMKAYHTKLGVYTTNIEDLREYSTPPFVLLEGVHYNIRLDDNVGIGIKLTSTGGYEASVIMGLYTATVNDERYLIVTTTTTTEDRSDNLAQQC